MRTKKGDVIILKINVLKMMEVGCGRQNPLIDTISFRRMPFL